MWISIRDEEVESLIETLQKSHPKVAQRIIEERKSLQSDEHRKLVDAAEQEYGEEGDRREISIDPDAALSHADTHTFVMAWVMVKHEDEGDGDEDDEDDGCPKCDPDCMGNAEDNHDACEWPKDLIETLDAELRRST